MTQSHELSAGAKAALPGGVAAEVEEYLRQFCLRFSSHGPTVRLSDGGMFRPFVCRQAL